MVPPYAASDPFTGALLQLLISVGVASLLGGIVAVMVAAMSGRISLRKDEREGRITAALPGLDCGRCGHATCSGYARAVANGGDPGLCMPGGAGSARLIGSILGVEVRPKGPRMTAQVHCRGGRDVSRYRFEYAGLSDCTALHMLYGGDKECIHSCLGLGSCVPVCPVSAIDYDATGKIRVSTDLCISCGKCIDVCPTGVLKMVPADADVIVACNSPDPAEQVSAYCSVGCTGCRLCERHSPAGGYHVSGNLCAVNYEQRGDRRSGMLACPTGSIIKATELARQMVAISKREVHE